MVVKDQLYHLEIYDEEKYQQILQIDAVMSSVITKDSENDHQHLLFA